MATKTDILRTLQGIQFTEYEAKAYLALLEKSPLTGYAVALNSGVPRSKIYEVLGNLAGRGDILVSREEPPLYSPLPPADLVTSRRRQAQQTCDEADAALKRYAETAGNRSNIWNINGRDAIMSRVKEAIKNADRRILMEIWETEADELREDLREAAARGVEIVLVCYEDVDLDFADVRLHDMEEKFREKYGGRWIVLSADDDEIVAGTISGEDSRAAWTTHPGLVMPISEFVIHDLYLDEILKAFRPQLEKKFGRNLAELRRKFTIDPKDKKYGSTRAPDDKQAQS